MAPPATGARRASRVAAIGRGGKRAAGVVELMRALRPQLPTTAARRALALVLTAAAALALAAPASAGPLLFGAHTPDDPYDGTTRASDALEAATGRSVDIVHWYQQWGGDAWISSVQPQMIAAVAGSGRMPLLTWEPWTPDAIEQPSFRLSRIADGAFDPYIIAWADALRATGTTIYLRPMHEFNGNWYPWAGTVNGNSARDFVLAWRHMFTLFAARGATNVRWVWSPNNFDVPATTANRMEAYYPGHPFVDVLAVDGYNWGSTRPQFGGWQTYGQVFDVAINRLKRIGPQPIWIAEVASAPEGGDKAAWIRDMWARAASTSRIAAIVWFNVDKERDWRATQTPATTAAFTPLGFAPARGGARLRLVAKPVRPGRIATLSWRATGAATVRDWHTYLNGRLVRVVRRGARPVARSRVVRSGLQRWTVVGRDAGGRRVVAASRSFRARKLR